MNAKLLRKVRKAVNAKEKEMDEEVFNHFYSLTFRERFRLAFRLIKGKL